MIPLDQMLGRKPFACPNCGKELPVADVNIAQDVALCRACGYQGAFLAAAERNFALLRPSHFIA